MKPRNALVSKVAAAALAFGLAQGAVAWAQENTEPAQSSADVTTMQATKGQLVSSWTISADPLIPIGLIAGLGLMYGAGCLIAARGKTKGAWLRAAAGGVMVVTLVNPEILTEEREVIPTEVVVVVDKSASQKLDGREASTQAAYDNVIRQLARIPGANIRTIELEETKEGAETSGTTLFKTIEGGLSDVPHDRLGAVIVLSDGVVHDAPQAIERLGKNVPLHVLVSGHEGEKDRRIIVENTQAYAPVNGKQTIRFHVVDDGADMTNLNKPLRVTIRNEGEEIESVMVTPGQQTDVTLTIPRAGKNMIEFQAEKMEGEITTVNNRVVRDIYGVEKNKNILLVSGSPDGNMRMWRNTIKSDPNVNLVNISILRPPEKQDNTPLKELSMISLPTHEIFSDKLKEFDLIIFDHYAYDGLVAAPYLENVSKYVREGGSLLVVAGPEYARNSSLAQTPLHAVLPAQPNGQIIEKSFVPKINAMGERHPVTRSMQPEQPEQPGQSGQNATAWGPWLRMVGVGSTKGLSLMDGAEGRPLLILNRQDEGRVALLLSDHAWLWANGYKSGGPSNLMIEGITSWLMKDKNFEEESLNISQVGNTLRISQQTMSDNSTPVVLRTPSGQKIPLVPANGEKGVWSSTVPAKEIGVYSVEQAGPHPATAFIDVSPKNAREYDEVISTTKILAPVVGTTGGAVVRMTGAKGDLVVPEMRGVATDNASQAMSGEGWMGVKMNGTTVLKGVNGQPLVPPWVALMLIIGALAQAYAREGDRSLFKRDTWRRTPKNNDGPQI